MSPAARRSIAASLPSSLAYLGLSAVGLLPRPVRVLLASVIGWLLRALLTREARVAAVNLDLAMPQLTPFERGQLQRACLRHTALTALETAAIWTQPAVRSLRWISAVEGEALLTAAESDGRGLIIAAPHCGNWELFSLYLASRRPLAVIYRPPERAAFEPLLIRARSHPGVTPIRAEPIAVRRMLGWLREGGTLGILPDQRPKAGEGLLAPLFGVPALTMTLLPRLAQKTGARVVFGLAERLPGAGGFHVRLLPAPAAIYDPDPLIAATALNAGIEACAALAPPQYQWNYKRYPAFDAEGRPRYGGHASADLPSGPP